MIRINKGDYPWLHPEAANLAAFLGKYASRIWDGELVVAGDPALPGVSQPGLTFLGRHLAPVQHRARLSG